MQDVFFASDCRKVCRGAAHTPADTRTYSHPYAIGVGVDGRATVKIVRASAVVAQKYGGGLRVKVDNGTECGAGGHASRDASHYQQESRWNHLLEVVPKQGTLGSCWMWRSSCWQASFGEALGMHALLGGGCVMETTMTDKEFFSFFVYLFF